MTKTEQVLAADPDNFQALSNLARFQFVTGHPEQANQTANRLLNVTADDHPAQDRLRLHLAFLKAGSPGPFGKKSGWLRDMLGKSLKDG